MGALEFARRIAQDEASHLEVRFGFMVNLTAML